MSRLAYLILIPLIVCGGLFQLGPISLREVALILFTILSAGLVAKKFDVKLIVSLVFFITSIICYVLFFDIGKIQYFLIYIVGIFIFFLIFLSDVDDNLYHRSLVIISWILVVSWLVNVCIIVFFSQPWVIIALITRTPEEFFGHLYHRTLLPFGTPPQLSFVASLLLLYFLFPIAEKKVNISLCLLLLGSILTSSSNSSLIPLFLILAYMSVFALGKFNLKAFIAMILIIFCSLSFALFYDVNFDTISFRSIDNIILSVDRHLMLRYQTIAAIIGWDWHTVFSGVGFGQSHSYIEGSYSFTVLLTVFFESGIVVAMVYAMFFYLLYIKLNANNMFKIWFFLFVASLLYQLNNDVSYFVIPALIAMAITRSSQHAK